MSKPIKVVVVVIVVVVVVFVKKKIRSKNFLIQKTIHVEKTLGLKVLNPKKF